jgi:hypothetical protein
LKEKSLYYLHKKLKIKKNQKKKHKKHFRGGEKMRASYTDKKEKKIFSCKVIYEEELPNI